MEGEDETSRQSSLPSSLIPHLYTRPQQQRDMLSGSGGTFRPLPRPSSPVTSGEARISDEPVRLPSTPMTMATVAVTSPPFVQGRSSPRNYSPYGPIDPDMHSRSAGMGVSENLQMPGVRRAVDTQAMPSGGQRYSNPIYSDPAYHVSRPFIPYRGPSYAPLPPAHREGFPRATWQAGRLPVTHEGASRARISPHQVGHVSQPPEVLNRPTWMGEDLEPFQRSGVMQPRPSMVMPPARTYVFFSFAEHGINQDVFLKTQPCRKQDFMRLRHPSQLGSCHRHTRCSQARRQACRLFMAGDTRRMFLRRILSQHQWRKSCGQAGKTKAPNLQIARRTGKLRKRKEMNQGQRTR